jgi:hypothetical protein
MIKPTIILRPFRERYVNREDSSLALGGSEDGESKIGTQHWSRPGGVDVNDLRLTADNR